MVDVVGEQVRRNSTCIYTSGDLKATGRIQSDMLQTMVGKCMLTVPPRLSGPYDCLPSPTQGHGPLDVKSLPICCAWLDVPLSAFA